MMEKRIQCSSRKYTFAATEFLISLLIYSVLTAWPGSNVVHAQTKYKEITVSNGGTIRGTVTLKGDASKISRMEITKDNKTCGKTKSLSCFSVGKKLGVANTFVYIENITKGKSVERKPSYTLHQQRCEYVPHTLIIPVGAQLEIVNNDPILHNVHTYLDGKPPKTLFNIAQPMKGVRMKSKPIEKRGRILATCDAGHPWMFAHVMVAEHPYYTTTDANGNFTIENVPPGNYIVQLWHEGVAITNEVREQGKVSKYDFEEPYEESKNVAVAPHGETVVDFELILR